MNLAEISHVIHFVCSYLFVFVLFLLLSLFFLSVPMFVGSRVLVPKNGTTVFGVSQHVIGKQSTFCDPLYKKKPIAVYRYLLLTFIALFVVKICF